MRDLAEKIARALVDFPDEVDVREISGIRNTLLEIRVSRKDIGKLIGKKSKNINALRSIVSAAGTGKGKHYTVEVVGEENRSSPRTRRGKIRRLFEDRNYGFIEADDGKAVFFQGSSLKGMAFQSLSVGQPVEFEVAESAKGLRVISVVRMTDEFSGSVPMDSSDPGQEGCNNHAEKDYLGRG
jgi:predicted RNA-binding protein YlqC (UPF0109 family)/cold shock CspA family protein